MSSEVAMLSSLSHLHDEPTGALELNHDPTPLSIQSQGYFVQHLPIAKSSDDHTMGLEGNDGEDRSEFLDYSHSDEDSDMSDGGAALTMTISHAEALNAEMDLLDAEIMGSDNLAGLLMSSYYESPTIEEPPDTSALVYSPADHDSTEDAVESTMEDEVQPAPLAITNLPMTMSAVAQQLQHLQDGQDHDAFAGAPDVLHGGIHENSTLPFPYHLQFSEIHLDFVSLADISPISHQTASTLGLPHASHLWPTGGWTPPLAMNLVLVSSQEQSDTIHFPLSDAIDIDDDQVTNADQDPIDDQVNLNLTDFLYHWAHSALPEEDLKRSPQGPSILAVENQRDVTDLNPVLRSGLQGERCDIQRINWAELGVSRLEARQMRRRTYRNYENLRARLQWHPRLNGSRLSDDQDFFRFRKMEFDHLALLSHFQLRNLLSCASRDHVLYAGRSVVYRYERTDIIDEPLAPTPIAMDFRNPTLQTVHSSMGNGIQISTLSVAHNILVAGGFTGEYGLVNLGAPANTAHSEGILTHHINGITNHVQVYLPRNSSAPVAAFASNDMSMRILDIATNKLLTEHKYEYAINCTAMSPDQRLRVLVGDNRNVMICNAETGEVLQDLEGHRDYGFACDWAEDGYTVATGNQDMQIKIWDARKWKTSSGFACPVATIAAEMAGVRKLKFSPLGSGRRVLIASEPADLVHVIDAEMFLSKQTLSFFGEIGGLDFANDGQDLIIANCDSMRGGIMEFERCNFAAEGKYNNDEDDQYAARRHRTRRDYGYDWKDLDEDIGQRPRTRGTGMQRSRRAAMLGTNMGIF